MKNRFLKNVFFRKSVALLLLLSILISFVPVNVIALGDTSTAGTQTTDKEETDAICDCGGVSVLHKGAEHRKISLLEDEEEILELFVFGDEPTHISWQILIPDSNRWVNIYGRNSDELTVNYALIESMMNGEGSAFIRASIKHGGATCISEPVEVELMHRAPETEEELAEAPALFAMRSAPALTADEGDGDVKYEICTIVINYIFDNGALAFEPYGATVAKGSDFTESIVSPTVVGYNPVVRSGDSYVDASTLQLNYTNITEDIIINVIYEPAIVKYQIHHHLQDLYDDDYPVTPDFITYGQGLTGTMTSGSLAMTEDELPGFKSLAYEHLEIAADGSTVIEIRYVRNYYLVDFDMAGGYGVEPVYVRYGTEVGANVPIRHGYLFKRWVLDSYAGRAPSAEEATLLDINAGAITVPAANLVYRANWETQIVTYTMVFWCENIEDNNFSFWGSLDGIQARSGSTVSASDRISEVAGIDDEKNFTYMDALSDKDVLVEGDGSTIVNVYYARNRYSITFKATGLCKIPVGHTHGDDCYDLLCKNDHVHTDECVPALTCREREHTEHTSACISCGKEEHTHGSVCCPKTEHTHSKSCFNNKNVGTATNKPSGAPNDPEDGYIHAVKSGTNWRPTYKYYVYIDGTWYNYTGTGASSGDLLAKTCGIDEEHTHGDSCCSTPEHTHSDSCYGDVLHTHGDSCYTYSCGATAHVHSDGCYFLDCVIPTGHSHSSTCNRSSSSNTVKIVKSKYQGNLDSIWPITDDNGKSYNNGERWSPSGSSTYSQVLVYISSMPGESFTLTSNTSSNSTYTMNYYLQVLDGEPYDVTYENKNFKLYTTIKAKYGYLTKAEDFFDINGFDQFASNPKYDNSGKVTINGGGTVNMYYTRIVDHYLRFRSNGDVIDDRTVYGLPYGASLKQYNFVPPYPDSLEPNAYFFDGWYTTPGHYPGTEVNWDTLSMDAGDVMLYAKWSPTRHTIKVYLDDTYTQQIGATQTVPHGSFATPPTEAVKKGDYIFQGWFYWDEAEKCEKAFVFTGIPVLDDLNIYAKWSSHVTVNYRINYVLYNSDPNAAKVVIADSTVGSGIAGSNKTFEAKAGDQLYEGYRVGFYPLTSSHTVTMSAEDIDHEFTFEYVYVESMPYIVRYLDENGNDLIEPKRVMDNTLSVVTETFVRFDKKMPDAYQKRLVLSADSEDLDNDGIYDANEIVFNYQTDEEHAYYKIVHYIQNLGGNGYREYRSEDLVGTIGETYSATPISMTGFSYNSAKTLVNGAYKPTTNGTVSEKLTSNGLLIELYYDREQYDYVVKYLESGTNKELYTEKHASGIYGEQIVENAPGLTHIGYKLVSDSVKQINLSANESLNVIEFYYIESEYSIKYQLVGPSEGASLSRISEAVKAVSGVPNGSRPLMNSGFHFVGWYLDAACTEPVPAAWVDSANIIRPTSDGIWLTDHTYYAKVDPDYTSLTINTVGVADVDTGEMFIFRVKGVSDGCTDIDLYVTVVGNSSVTITHLPVGEYRITELVGWAYRYTPDEDSKTVTISYSSVSTNSVTFSHMRTNVNWLDGNDNKPNIYN